MYPGAVVVSLGQTRNNNLGIIGQNLGTTPPNATQTKGRLLSIDKILTISTFFRKIHTRNI
jgi:hypothetical protein